jgi:hypothetical protein
MARKVLSTYLPFMIKTIMKKILLIDDKILPNSNHCEVDKWKKIVESQYQDYVDIGRTPEEYFDWDNAGNYCNPKFNIEDYAFVFIHHSQKGDSYFPSNTMEFIKQSLKEKLVLFSGNIEEKIINDEYPDFTYRSIRRQNLSDKLSSFIKKSILLHSWEIELLFFDYEKRLIGNIMKMIDANLPKEEVIKSNEVQQFLALKFVNINSKLYHEIISEEGDLINTLRNL